MQGGIPLQGKVRIQGSKNAVLPILAATLLTNEYPIFRTAHVLQMYTVSCICFGNWDVWCTGRKKGSGYSREKMKNFPARERRPDGCRGKLSPECVHLCACWEHCWEDVVM